MDLSPGPFPRWKVPIASNRQPAYRAGVQRDSPRENRQRGRQAKTERLADVARGRVGVARGVSIERRASPLVLLDRADS